MQNIIDNSQQINIIDIIAIDGTTASGKGSLARKLAKQYNFHYLNSGALYRLTAFILKEKGFDFDKYHIMRKEIESGVRNANDPDYIIAENMVVDTGKSLDPIFDGKKVILNDIDIWSIIQTQEYGNFAARI